MSLPEAVKDIRKELRANTLARIIYLDLGIGASPCEPDSNSPILGSESDRIGKQVPYDLLQAIGVTGDRAGRRVEFYFKSNAFGCSRWTHGIEGRPRNR